MILGLGTRLRSIPATFVELVDHHCAVAVTWSGSVGDLGGCYADSEQDHS